MVPAQELAIAHVASLATGAPVDLALTTAELRRYPAYRGPEIVALGVALARYGRLDPGVIGAASRTGRYDEQALKRVWHYVARFGSPETSGGGSRDRRPHRRSASAA